MCRPSTPGSNVRPMPVTNEAPNVRFLHRLQSTTDAWRKTLFLGKSRGTSRHCRCFQHQKSAMPTTNTRENFLMYHVQNILSGRSHKMRFTSVARHDQKNLIARAHMVGRTTRNSSIRISMWNVVPHPQHGINNNSPKQPTSPVSTHGEVVKTNKSETFDAICFDPSSNIA